MSALGSAVSSGCDTRGRHVLKGIFPACNVLRMHLDVSREFGGWVDRAKAKAAEGSAYHRRVLELVAVALTELRNLSEPPTDDKPSLKRVRQSKQFQVWRTSHPFEVGIAARLICWFPPDDAGSCVVTLFGSDKAAMGDVFYDSVGHRADMAIEQWLREKGREKDNE